MTTDELIARARKAIETGQLNLAQLYMRKAIEQTNQHRRELAPLAWQARQMVQGFQAFGDATTEVGKKWAKIFDNVSKAFAPEPDTHRKSDYTLAAGRRG